MPMATERRRESDVSGTYRSRPPFGVVTWPFQSDRVTQICRLPGLTSRHSSAIISPPRRPASPPRSTMRCAVASSALAAKTESLVLSW